MFHAEYQLSSPFKVVLTLESVNCFFSSFITFASLIMADCFYDKVHLNEIKFRQDWVIMIKKYVFPFILFGYSVVIFVIDIIYIYVCPNDHSKMIQTSVQVSSMISLFETIGIFDRGIAGGGRFVEKNLQYSFIFCFPIISIYSFHIWYDHYAREGKLAEYIRGGFISAYLSLPFQALCKHSWCWVVVCICGFHCH